MTDGVLVGVVRLAVLWPVNGQLRICVDLRV